MADAEGITKAGMLELARLSNDEKLTLGTVLGDYLTSKISVQDFWAWIEKFRADFALVVLEEAQRRESSYPANLRLRTREEVVAAVRARNGEGATMKKWKMPKWMRRYEAYLTNAGGNDVTEMVNGDADPRVNLPLSTLQACVKSQVVLLERLHEEGHLER